MSAGKRFKSLLIKEGGCLLFCNIFCHSLYGLELYYGYEPFLLKQFNFQRSIMVQSGVGVGDSVPGQEETDLLMHLFSFRLKTAWPSFIKNFFWGIETGFSASPVPIRKHWITPALPADFTGIITYPIALDSNYWKGHELDFVFGQEHYLIEETSLAYVPFGFNLERLLFSRGAWNLTWETHAGFSMFYVSTRRNRISGNRALFQSYAASFFHLSQNLGMNLFFKYRFNSQSALFCAVDFNAVSNLSDFQFNIAGSDFSNYVDGYRFDGLRYNYKLGVTWKL